MELKDNHQQADELSLYIILLGANPRGRNVEQHDYYFTIARTLKELVPAMKAFWPEAGASLHVDGWRRVRQVDGYDIRIVERKDLVGNDMDENGDRLFFVNLGGYTEYKLEEQHYTLLTVQENKVGALRHSKATEFFKNNTIQSVREANAHIDEKYGIDVDDFYRIDDLLSADLKMNYLITITPAVAIQSDKVHLGYLRLDKIEEAKETL